VLCFRCGHYSPDGSIKCPSCGQVFAGGPSGGAGGEITRRKTTATRGPQAIFSVGETVAERYKIMDVIGTGAVGTVYRAHDSDIDVDVALKAIAPKLLQTNEEQKVFSKFIKSARKLHHANIVRIYDEGHDQGPQHDRRFFTMQLLEGLTLRKIIQLRREKGQVFSLAEVEPIFAQLAAALDYAHKSQWHGSLKPENVIVLPDLLKITDFCLIQALPTKPFLAIQKSRGAPFHYIAPEVRLEASRIDGRADVYSLGVILAEMLTGELFDAHDPKPFYRALDGLNRPVDQLIRRAIHETADGRFQSAGDLAEALSDLAAGAEDHSGPTSSEDLGPADSPPTPPPDSDVHRLDPLSASDNVPELSGSSVLLIDATKALQEATDVTQLPDEFQAMGRSDDSVRVRTDPDREHGTSPEVPTQKGGDTVSEGRPLRRDPGPPRPNEPTSSDDRGEPEEADPDEIHDDDGDEGEDDEPDTSPGKKPRGRAHNVPAEAVRDHLGPPPPVSDEISANNLEARSAGDIHGQPTQARAVAPGIHDALTSLRIQSPGRRSPTGELSAPAPAPAIAISPEADEEPPPLEEPPPDAGRSRVLFLALFITLGLGLGAGIFFTVRYIIELRAMVAATGRPSGSPPVALVTPPPASSGAGVTPVTPSASAAVPPAVSTAALPPVSAPAPRVDEEKVRRAQEEMERRAREEEERRRRAQEAEEARARVEQEKRQREEERRVREEQERQRKTDTSDEQRRKREEEKAARAAAAEEARAAKAAAAEDQKRAQEEDRRRKEDERRRREEERRQKEDEDRRRKEEEKARAAAAAQAQATAGTADPSSLSPEGCPRGMAFVPAGPFKMGSAGDDPMHNFEEKRLETVEVTGFCVDYYEFPNSKAQKPVTNVTWFQAQELCKAKGKRLCEEAEWEKACKGPGMSRYPYGNSWDPDKCNTQDAEGNDRELAEQKAFPKCKSGYNTINMSGNASEWTGSTFSPAVKDRVHKGGASNRPDWATRCANRANLAPSSKQPFVGFRCCADPAPAP
jgi:serine/threonine protein kinase/formylglycine-generating enzyme required for sulfatase activity